MKHGPDKVIIFIPTFGYYRINRSDVALFQDGIELAAEATDPAPILNQLAYRAAASDTEVSVGSLMEEFPDRAPSLNKEIQLEDGDKVIRFGLDGSRQDEVIKESRVISNADEGIGGRRQEDPSEDIREGRGDQAFQDSTPQSVPQRQAVRQEQPQAQLAQQEDGRDISPEEAELIRQASEVTPARRAEIIQGVQARVAALGQRNAEASRGGFSLGKLGNAIAGIDQALGSIVNRVVGVGQPSVLEDISKAGSAQVRKLIGDEVRPDEIAAQRRLAGIEGLVFSQAVQDGFLKPAAATIDFAARLVGGLDIESLDEFEEALDRADDFVGSRLEGTISQAEQIALSIGFTERQVASMQTGGSIFGFVWPIGGALKAASIITRFKGGVGLRFMVRDVTAGAIYGGVLAEEGELGHRFTSAWHEAGIFGGFSALMGLTPWVRVARFKRQLTRVGFSRAEAKAIHKFLKDGKAVIPDGEAGITAKQFMEMLADEQIISRSPAAQSVLTRNADLDAMVTGLRDIASDRTGHVILNNVKNREEFTTKLKELFPGVKLTAVKSVDGGGFTFVASFGERGLNNAQREQLAQFGYFNGQRITHGGVQYEIAGVTDAGKIIRKTLDGKKIPGGVNPENVSFYGSARNLEVAEDALFRDFSAWLEGKINQISEAGGVGLTREELLNQLAKGEFNAARLSTRATVGEHILIPEEAGLDAAQEIVVAATRPRGINPRINVKQALPSELPISLEQAQQALSEGKIFLQVLRGNEPTIIIEANLSQPGVAVITGVGGQSLENLPRGTAKIIGERVAEAIKSVERVEFAGIRNPVFESSGSNILRGAEDIVILPPEPMIGFTDAVEVYLKEKGIIGSDVAVFKEFAAQRMRKLLFETLPEAEKTLITNLRNGYARNLNRARTDLEYKAATQGFKLEQANGVHKLTDVNSGAEFFFESEKGLKEALKVARTDRNLTEYSSQLPDDFATIGSPETPGIDLAGDLLDVPTESFARNLLKDVPDTKFFNNIRDSTLKFEEKTGIPLHSKFFEPLFADMTRARNEIAITLPRLQKQWKVLSKHQRVQIADYWQAIEGKGLSTAEKLTAARAFGLNDKQIKVAGDMRRVWNDAFERTGMPREMFIDEYYARIRPYMEEHGTISRQGVYNGTPPAGMDPWFENWRIGELADIEKDPMVVMMKWFKADSMNRHVGESWDKVTQLVGFGQRGAKGSLKPFRFNQLDPAQQVRVSKFYEEINLKLDPTASVIPDFYADQLSQVLLNMRGSRSAALSTSAGIFRRIFKGMGVEVSDPVLSQLFADMQSTMFGALVATPRAVARNMVTQALFFDYGRFGAEALGKAMTVSKDFRFYEKAVQDGAVRFTEGGLVGFDVAFEQILVPGSKALDVTKPWGHATSAGLRLLLRGGKVSRGMARKFLTPYSTVDELNRVRSYWAARFNAEKHLAAFKSGRISEKEFLERTTMGFSPSIKKTFIERLKVSDDRGLGYLGKTAADENHFIYAMSTQPLALQTGAGRFLGMFASWPLWAIQMYTFRLGNMSFRQQLLFTARNSIAAGSIGVVGLELGYNLWSWIAPTSMFTYGGGPGVEMVDGMRDLIRAPIDRKAGAIQKLTRLFGKVAFPGMQTVRDINRVLEDTNDPMEMAFGMVLGRPTDRGIEIDFSKMLDQEDRAAVAGKQPFPLLETGIGDSATSQLNEGLNQRQGSVLDRLEGTVQPTTPSPVTQP